MPTTMLTILKPIRPPLAARLGRSLSTTASPVPLAYHLYPAPDPATAKNGSPLVIMHGLFGSKQNSSSISKALARDLNRPVYTLDLRNHGSSPHAPHHDYASMSSDVELFLRTQNLGPDTALLGHSMGAKTAMAVVLRDPSLASSIISVDNAPLATPLHASFGSYVRAMREIEAAGCKRQSEADEILAGVESDVAVRRFLLTNLVRGEGGDGRLRFRIPLATLAREIDNVADFPFHHDEVRFEKRALFVRGLKSPYVPDEAIPAIGRFFPMFRLKDVDAGHWVISEKPDEFRQAVVEFLNEEESS